MTALFALIYPSLLMIESAFSTYVYDGVRTLEGHWDTMLNAIQIGALPDIHHLNSEFNTMLGSTSFLTCRSCRAHRHE
jgi:hypothetical protein